MNLAQLLHRTATTNGERPAVYRGSELLYDYATLRLRAATLAHSLAQGHGLAPGARVALFLHNDPAVLEILFGCWWAGLVVVPINPKLHPREAHYILEHSGAAVAFSTRALGGAVLDVTPALPGLREMVFIEDARYAQLHCGEAMRAPLHRAPEELAWLFYTSGTTGRPKGVMLSHRNLMAMTLCYFTDVDSVQSHDAALYAAPMSHGAGLYAFPHVLAGARHVVPDSRGFDPAEIFELARHHMSVSMFAAPTMVRRLVEHAQSHGENGEGLKTIVYGGGPMYVEDIQRAIAVLGQRFVQIYGQGESPMTITALSRDQLMDTTHPRYLQRLASVGVAQSAVEVRVADDGTGEPLPVGHTGEVLVRGDSVMAGYWRDEAATAKTLRDGWLYTGDLGQLDEHGFLTLRDRSKDVVISGGSNIYPREVEEVLLRHPAVAEVSVVGKPDEEWGEIVVAFVSAREGAAIDTRELDALCQQHIARFKRPKEYHVLDALPKNHYGKILKTELRQRLIASKTESKT